MTAVYILIILLMGGGQPYGLAIDFNTLEACEVARHEINVWGAVTACVPKGKPQYYEQTAAHPATIAAAKAPEPSCEPVLAQAPHKFKRRHHYRRRHRVHRPEYRYTWD